MWQSCQHRWSLDYLAGHRAEVFSKYMDFGTAIHAALEKYKNPNKEKKASLEEAYSEFEKVFREKYTTSAIHEAKIFDALPDNEKKPHKAPLTLEQINEWILVGIHIIKNLHNLKELDGARVLFVEHTLMEDIDRTDDIKIKFKGFIDIIIKTKDKRGKSVVYICDYKTCSWGWTMEKKKDESLHAQLRLYKHFFCKQFKLDPKQVRCAFILLKRTPKGDNVADWFAISAGPKTVARAVENVNSAVTGMASGIYKKNRSQCINDYGDRCPYYETASCLKD